MNVNTQLASWIYVIPSVLIALFYLAALLFVASRRSDQSSAKPLAIAGIGLLLFLQVMRFVVNAALIYAFGAGDFVLYQALYGIVASLLHMLALTLLVLAVFAGRSQDPAPTSAGKLWPEDGDNPYSSPAT